LHRLVSRLRDPFFRPSLVRRGLQNLP
jgi:hypothetical protein